MMTAGHRICPIEPSAREPRPRRVPAQQCRRGGAMVELVVVLGVFFAFIFGIIEFGWMANSLNRLENGVTVAARAGALGAPIATIQNTVRTRSDLGVANSYLQIQYNSQEDLQGTWSDVTDDGSSGSPPTRNAVPPGRPVRVRVAAWPYRLVTGSLFRWLPGYSHGTIPMYAQSTTRHE